MKILKFLIFNTVSLIFAQNLFADTAIGQEIAELKSQIATLKTITRELVTKMNKTIGPGMPELDTHLKTGNCIVLNNQPTNACSIGTCYNTNTFMDQAPVSLIGCRFTAIKSTADPTNRDGGIWLCDERNLGAATANQCTNIGRNRRDGSKTVEFTIPVGATGKYIYAVGPTGLLGASAISAMTTFSLCRTVEAMSLDP